MVQTRANIYFRFCMKLVFINRYTTQVLELMQMHPKERLRRVILTANWFIAINVGYHRSCTIELYEKERWQGSHTLAQFSPCEFPVNSLAYSHISLKGPSTSMIYGKIFGLLYPIPI